VSAPLRRAGHARLAEGSAVTWTVAEGAKGRRWREVVTRDGMIVHSLLLETFPDGRFAHLELSTPAGLLTLHPEGDGTLHGNAVAGGGVRHVVGPAWPPGAVVLVEGSSIAMAAAGASAGRRAIVVHSDLSLESRVLGGAEPWPAAEADGTPRIEGGASWPLELDRTAEGVRDG
jgi:hypothetical protein